MAVAWPIPRLAPVTIAILSLIFIPPCSIRMAHDHLAVGLVGFHHTMRFANLVETKHTGRFGLPFACRDIGGNLLQRYVRQREAGRAEYKTAEEGQVDAARHLQQR